jgi:hypothetical protein
MIVFCDAAAGELVAAIVAAPDVLDRISEPLSEQATSRIDV